MVNKNNYETHALVTRSTVLRELFEPVSIGAFEFGFSVCTVRSVKQPASLSFAANLLMSSYTLLWTRSLCWGQSCDGGQQRQAMTSTRQTNTKCLQSAHQCSCSVKNNLGSHCPQTFLKVSVASRSSDTQNLNFRQLFTLLNFANAASSILLHSLRWANLSFGSFYVVIANYSRNLQSLFRLLPIRNVGHIVLRQDVGSNETIFSLETPNVRFNITWRGGPGFQFHLW